MGLTKAFVCPTQDDGDISLIAAAVIGEKRQLTSSLVSIDVKSVALRGNEKSFEYDVFYTLDGTEPSKSSERYLYAFSVALGTTVKAAVYKRGEEEPLFIMEERFAKDEGMYWDLGEKREDSERKTVVTIDASCIEDFRLGAEGLSVRSFAGTPDADGQKWIMITDPDGFLSFINVENGGALITNGSTVLVGQNGLFDTGKWLRIGEAEHYDYLVHASSGKILALSDDGRLILDDRSKHNDADMRSSRAFWNIKEVF
jgi:hypothetical protein